ncbi:sulfotransferase family protein [Kineosporia babensis]|uniref:Sulfotransferase family protein n=1 Tax=Kineosporia babensis TaxID=499548 RepID=A0A9X1SXE7_9ACTN|nr:sulfotransferase family protein [Kineosporia babensis]MCD5315744.1 hypothetical protein [Kineosporia babensis]
MLKLMNVGLGRTGTTSLKRALETIGWGPSFHMFDVISDDDRLRSWEQIVVDGQEPDWEKVFEGYTSVVDGPGSLYYRQILQALPETKVVLTIRDGEEWYRSTYDTLYQFVLRARQSPPPPDSTPARILRVTDSLVWSGLFGGRFEERDHAIAAFREHNQGVVNSIDPDNLLVYDVKQGWEPLCSFLGVPRPSEPFPHLNDTESMKRNVEKAGRS